MVPGTTGHIPKPESTSQDMLTSQGQTPFGRGGSRPLIATASQGLGWRNDTGRSGAMSYEYKVVEIREGMIGGKMSGDKLEKVLNEHAGAGWQLKAITSVEVKGRVGPGGVDGILVTFERPRS